MFYGPGIFKIPALHKSIFDSCSTDFKANMDLPLIYESNFKIAEPIKSGGSSECRALQQHLIAVIRGACLKVFGCALSVGLEQPQHVRTRNADLGRMAGSLRDWVGVERAAKAKIGWGQASDVTFGNAIVGRYNRSAVWIWLDKNLIKMMPDKTASDVLDLKMCCGLDSE